MRTTGIRKIWQNDLSKYHHKRTRFTLMWDDLDLFSRVHLTVALRVCPRMIRLSIAARQLLVEMMRRQHLDKTLRGTMKSCLSCMRKDHSLLVKAVEHLEGDPLEREVIGCTRDLYPRPEKFQDDPHSTSLIVSQMLCRVVSWACCSLEDWVMEGVEHSGLFFRQVLAIVKALPLLFKHFLLVSRERPHLLRLLRKTAKSNRTLLVEQYQKLEDRLWRANFNLLLALKQTNLEHPLLSQARDLLKEYGAVHWIKT